MMGETTSKRLPLPRVALLGAGTMGAGFVDYIIADSIVLPFDRQPFYTEKIVHLPNSFQPNDSQRKIAADTESTEKVEAAGV